MKHSTILIIGGNGSKRNRHAIELETHGYQVKCAHSTQTAMQLYLEEPPALVLFALDEDDRKAWQVYRRLTREYPVQKKAFALSGSQRLCSVSIEDAELIKAQGPDDLIAAVVELIGTARPKLTMPTSSHNGTRRK